MLTPPKVFDRDGDPSESQPFACFPSLVGGLVSAIWVSLLEKDVDADKEGRNHDGSEDEGESGDEYGGG